MIPVETAILRDLIISQSTASSIAGRLKLPTDAVTVILHRLLAAKTITAHPLAGLVIYRLTPATLQNLTAPTP